MTDWSQLPDGIKPMTFEEGQRLFGSADGEAVELCAIELGGRGHLGAADIVRASEMLHTAIGSLRGTQTLVLTIGGFDEDPRELHEVKDVVTFIRRVMRHAGIVHWQHEAVRLFDDTTVAFLVQCGVFGTDHPYTLITGSGASLWDVRQRGNRRSRGML